MRQSIPISFRGCCVLGPDWLGGLYEVDQIAAAGNQNTSDMRLSTEGEWGSGDLEWSATCIAQPYGAPVRQWVVTGPEGMTLEFVQGQVDEYPIDSSKQGPLVHGAIRDLRLIGKHIYAVGMRRQVYRRLDEGKWERIDEGVLQKPKLTEIAGFNSIDGISEGDLYAAGYGGEIWRRQGGKWKPLSSPTDVILNKVLATKDTVYICGQGGVLLAGKGAKWQIVATADEDLWDMAWFNGQLWLAGDDHLFVYKDGCLEQIDVDYLVKTGMTKAKKAKWGKKRAKNPTVGSLAASDTVLWSMGRKHVLWTKDGESWTEVTP